jgi:hypothetical protein
MNVKTFETLEDACQWLGIGTTEKPTLP